MGTFPSAALSIKPPENPLDQYAKALSVKSMIGGEQLQQQEIEKNQLAINDQKSMTAAMQEWDGKSYDDLLPLVKKHGGSANAVIGLKNQVLAQQEKKSTIAKNDAETNSKQLDTLSKKNDMLLGHLNAATSVSDDKLVDAVHTEKNAAIAGQYLDKEHADVLEQLLATNDPKKIRPALEIFEKGLRGEKEQFEQAQKERETAAKEWKEIPGTSSFYNTRTFELRHPEGMKMTPSQAEANYIDLASKKATGTALTKQEQAQMTGFEQYKKIIPQFQFNVSGGATGGLDQAAIDQQAEAYWNTGKLPPAGRGVAGMALVHTIMQRASDMHKGESLAANTEAFKANAASLHKLQTTFDAMSGFEGTALRNLDLYMSKLKAIPDLGVKFANVPLRSLTASMIGEKNLAAVHAARLTAATETAKVLGSATGAGVLSDTQQKEVLDMLDGNLPFASSASVVETLKQDMANRHESYQHQINDIKGRMGGKTSETPAASAAQTGAVGKFSVAVPGGKTFHFATQADADAFKKKAGIK